MATNNDSCPLRRLFHYHNKSMATDQALAAAKFVGCSRNGTRPTVPSGEIEHMRFEIYDFAARDEERGTYIRSNTLKDHGYEWYLEVYPRGDSRLNKKKEYISLYLGVKLRDAISSVDAKSTFKFGNKAMTLSKHTFSKKVSSWGRTEWISRKDVVSTCLDQNGTLVIDVYVELYVTDKPTIWYPPTLPNTDIFLSQLYTDEETKDVTFSIQTQTYRAHKLVLRSRASILFYLAKDFQPDDTSMMLEIPNVDVAAFDNIIKHIYTVLDLNKAFRDFHITMRTLQAADRFRCTDLKLYTESVLVDKFLKVEHWSDLLLFADSHSLPLLKEAVFKLYVSDPASCQQSNGWAKVKESAKILAELLEFQASDKPCDIPKHGLTQSKQVDSLDVASLREQVEKAKLDLDGSREMLVSRLKSHLFLPEGRASNTDTGVQSRAGNDLWYYFLYTSMY